MLGRNLNSLRSNLWRQTHTTSILPWVLSSRFTHNTISHTHTHITHTSKPLNHVRSHNQKSFNIYIYRLVTFINPKQKWRQVSTRHGRSGTSSHDHRGGWRSGSPGSGNHGDRLGYTLTVPKTLAQLVHIKKLIPTKTEREVIYNFPKAFFHDM